MGVAACSFRGEGKGGNHAREDLGGGNQPQGPELPRPHVGKTAPAIPSRCKSDPRGSSLGRLGSSLQEGAPKCTLSSWSRDSASAVDQAPPPAPPRLHTLQNISDDKGRLGLPQTSPAPLQASHHQSKGESRACQAGQRFLRTGSWTGRD